MEIFMKTIFLGIMLTTSLLVTSAQVAEAANCPSKPQTIKVIDLKSGWWQGDGGDTDKYVIDHLKKECPNVHVYYQHSLQYGGGFGGGFGQPRPPVSSNEPVDFDQIWLLSGGEADGADLRTDSAEFVKYLNLMTNSKGNLFIGTGFGNVYHANALTRSLGLGDLILTDRETHEYPSPLSGLTVTSTLSVNSEHPLLKGILVLPHVIKIGEFVAPSDRLRATPELQTLVNEDNGNIVIGELTVNGRKLILDANLARTYLIREGHVEIQKYLTNLVTALEK